MTGTKRKALPPVDTGPRCGSCKWWRRWDDSTNGQGADDLGRCMLSPPTMLLDGDGEVCAVWPTLEATEFACSHFIGKH